MSTANVKLVRRAVDAANRRDFAALPELFDSDIEYRESPEWPDAGIYVGLPAFERYFMRALEQLGRGYHTDLEGCVESGDRVLAFLRARGVAVNGAPIDVPFFGIYTFREGKCAWLEGFLDPARAEQAWGEPIGHPRQPAA
jgi:ketosteroid isomerase-like protein